MTTTATKPRLKLWPHQIAEGPKPVPAFEVDGITYYHYPNDLEARTGRIMAAMDVYREMEFNCSRKDLEALIAAQKAAADKVKASLVAKGGKLDLMAAVEALNEFTATAGMLETRIQWIGNIQLLLKLASVLYFDENEDPYSMDMHYAATVKIPRWEAAMQRKELPAFFFRKPIREFLPFSDTSEPITPQHSQLLAELLTTEKERSMQIYKSLSSLLSGTSNNNGVTDYLASQMEILQKQMPSTEKALTPTE